MWDGGLAAFALVALVAFWAVYDLSFQRRIKRLFYSEGDRLVAQAEGGRWVETQRGAGSVRTWVPATKVVMGSPEMPWDRKMSILRRHQAIGLALAVLVLADLSWGVYIFRRDYNDLRAAWVVAGPRSIKTYKPSGGFPRRVALVYMGGHAEGMPLEGGGMVVNDRGIQNSGLYLFSATGKLVWEYEPPGGSIGAVTAGADQEGRSLIAFWDGTAYRVVRSEAGGERVVEGTQETLPPMVNQRLLTLTWGERTSVPVTRTAGRYRVESRFSGRSVWGVVMSTVILYDDGP